MGHPYSRRHPRLALPALPRLDAVGLWRRHREALHAQLGPVLGLLLVLCGALWAVGEYASYKAEVRRAETGRYLAEFRAAPVGDAWGRLSAAWQAEQGRQDTLLARVAGASGAPFEQAVRNYRDFVVDTVEEHRLPPDIATVRAFFVRLGICVRAGSCDPQTAAAQFGPAVWQFRNQHYYYFALEGFAAEFDQSALLIATPARRKPAA